MLRDDRVFVVATDDTYAPSQYFEFLALPRVKVVVLPTPVDSGLSAPSHVVQRLKDAFRTVTQRKEVQSGDEFWVLLDTDHHFQDKNLKTTLEAITKASQAGFEVAVSNPCFELWLLLHYANVLPGTVFSNCKDVIEQLKSCSGGYDKTSIKTGQFPMSRVPEAIRRARVLETMPDAPNGPWPQQAGTRLYRLLEGVMQSPP